MAKRREREKAIQLRLEGRSYSEIKRKLDISKSTLSYWLRDYPLSENRLRELRDNNPRRIERFRQTMQRKREEKIQRAYEKAEKDIKKLSKRDLFIAGFFLYWAEGTKTTNATTAIANTDFAMLKAFIKWLEFMGIKKNALKIKLHLYSDMNINEEIKFWSIKLGMPLHRFRKPYIKKTQLNRVHYKGRFGHGTCNVILENRKITDYILGGLSFIRKKWLAK